MGVGGVGSGWRWVAAVTALAACGALQSSSPSEPPNQQHGQPAETCNAAWTPTWRQGSGANEYWVEVTITGGTPQSASLEVGTRRVALTLQWGKWVGRTTRIVRGTPVTLRAENALGEIAQTYGFGWLMQVEPMTDPCAGTCAPSCGAAVCGGDGCGGSCGSCPSDARCEAGACVGFDDDGGTPLEPGCDGGSCDGGMPVEPGGDGGTVVEPDGGCTSSGWSPQWQQGSANSWWIEYTIGPGTVTSAALEVVGGARTNLTLSWGKWTGRPSPSIPSGAQVVLHATDSAGRTASTVPFGYLTETRPQTAGCSGAAVPDAGSSAPDAGVSTPDAGSSSCGGLTEGMVTIHFDDAFAAQYTLARQPLIDHGMKASLYFITERVGTGWSGYLTMAQAQALAADGHELGSHTTSHENLTQMTDAQIEDQLRISKQWLEANFGRSIAHFATPFGAYDSRVVASARRHYQTHSTVENGLNYRGADLYRLKRYTVTTGMTPAQIRALVQQAQSSRGWLILLFHDFTAGTPSDQYRYRISDFETVLDDLAASGVDVVTTSQALARLRCP